MFRTLQLSSLNSSIAPAPAPSQPAVLRSCFRTAVVVPASFPHTPSCMFNLGSALSSSTGPRFRVRRTCITAMPVVTENSTLRKCKQVEYQAIAPTPGTYHSKAPNTAAAFAAEHTCPKHTRSLRKTANAMKPANQKIVVKPSTPSMTNL